MKKILSSILLLIFFAGQINLAWASHFCGDKLVSNELTLNPKSADCCGSDSKVPMDCCEDEIAQADADDFFKKSEIKTQISPEFLLSYVLTYVGIDAIETDFQTPSPYFPDIPISDLQVLHQTFLI
ncbi:hypothetical protein [Algoriphagus sp. A40]|uniref:HYC_CC_PP family protein n=1 Tax=Algoriphagus sp. A40 TaxID=1945863 RepID=UPI000986E06E|nr:hypothetical protein [Algoriphagus sp. A40]OOG76839.1 hypothetical protein B0E43_07595 [Algoriphagus sp. A40]